MESQSLRYLSTILNDRVLQFGSFTTKSGRKSPYFFNTGRICTANSLNIVADAYAHKILECIGSNVDNFFGPAYKGIPLAVATAHRYASLTGQNISYTFNRKEIKDHGEGGTLIGADYHKPTQVVIVEDVLTAGTSLRESLTLLKKYPVSVIGVIVGIDRQERGSTGRSASEEICQDYNIPIHSIVNLDQIIAALWNKEVLGKVWIDDSVKLAIDNYRNQYCAT